MISTHSFLRIRSTCLELNIGTNVYSYSTRHLREQMIIHRHRRSHRNQQPKNHVSNVPKRSEQMARLTPRRGLLRRPPLLLLISTMSSVRASNLNSRSSTGCISLNIAFFRIVCMEVAKLVVKIIVLTCKISTVPRSCNSFDGFDGC